ncbi:hypothetical protein LCGC14_1336890 [marine sediment metagenome]|uniref:Uncharacterized protein n=1 Tax=marine sediment metagenome TaxID=412755 RepID=A0A0F9L147_9ZZZZ
MSRIALAIVFSALVYGAVEIRNADLFAPIRMFAPTRATVDLIDRGYWCAKYDLCQAQEIGV